MDPLAQLFARYRDGGDLRALGAVFDELAPRLLLVALHLTGRRSDAEDVLQETFLLAIERAATFDATRRLEPWLAGMLTNVARNARRSARRRAAEQLPERGDATGDPATAAERREFVLQVRAQLDMLPPEQRQVLLLRLQHGMSPAAIAEVLDVPAGAVRMRIHRGLHALRRLLPAGLFGFARVDLSPPALVSVRAAVLRAGAPHAAAAAAIVAAHTTTVIGGSLVLKKLLAALAVAVGCGLLWWAFTDHAPPPLPRDGAAAAATPAVGSTASPSAVPRVAEPSLEREAQPSRDATGALRVRALGELGDERLPMPGVLVDVWAGADTLPPFGDELLRRRTDAAGEVSLPVLAVGTWQVQLPGVRDASSRTADVVADAETTIEVVQAAKYVANGIVVDADGVPVAGAELWVSRGTYLGRYSLPEPGELESRCAAISAEDGTFRIAVLANEQRVAASHPGHGESMARYFVNGEHDIRLVLGRASAELTVTVRDAAGAPVTDALVRLDPPGQNARRSADGNLLAPRVPRLARTDATGSCTFAGLAPGEQRVIANAYPRNPAWQTVTVAAFARADVVLALEPGVTVVGTVRTAAGAPARVQMCSRSTPDLNGHWSQCDVREDGSYLLQYQPQRSFFVVAIAGGVVASREIVDPPPGVVRCDFVLDDLQVLRGRVVTDDGRALAGWNVTVLEQRRASELVSGADGAFAVTQPKGTKCTLRAAPSGSTVPLVELADVAAPGPVELRVPTASMPSARVRGRLVAADGMPVAGRSVALVVADEVEIAQRPVRMQVGDRRAKRTVDTAADGTFAFADLPASRYALGYWRGGYTVPLRLDLDFAIAQHVELGDLVLPAMATALVEFVHADGRPWTADAAGIDLRRDDGEEVIVEHAHAERGMRLTVEPGTYRLSVRATDLIAPPTAVKLTAGAETKLRVPLTIGRTLRLTFNTDGAGHPAMNAPLHVVVRPGPAEPVVDQDAQQAWDLRAFFYWTVRTTLPFGHYDVEANGGDGLRYRGSFEVSADVEAATDIDVPRQR